MELDDGTVGHGARHRRKGGAARRPSRRVVSENVTGCVQDSRNLSVSRGNQVSNSVVSINFLPKLIPCDGRGEGAAVAEEDVVLGAVRRLLEVEPRKCHLNRKGRVGDSDMVDVAA